MEFKWVIFALLLRVSSLFKVTRAEIDHRTFTIKAMFPVTETLAGGEKKINWHSGYLMAEALLYSIQQIDKKVNLTTKGERYRLHHAEISDVSKIFDSRKAFLHSFMGGSAAITVGAYSPHSTFISGILAETFEQPLVSYTAPSLQENSEKYTLHSVPSVRYQIHALLDVVSALRWNYLSVISSFNHDGESDSPYFIKLLQSIGVCLAKQIDLPKNPKPSDFDEIFEKKLRSENGRSHGLVLFTNHVDAYQFFAALKRRYEDRVMPFKIICLHGCTIYGENTLGNEIVIEGTLSISLKARELPGFRDYITSQRDVTKYLEYNKEWQKFITCSDLNETTCLPRNLTTDVFRKTFQNYTLDDIYNPLVPVQAVWDIAEKTAHSLLTMLNDLKDTDQWPINALNIDDYVHEFSNVFIPQANQDRVLSSSSRVEYSIVRFQQNNQGKYENVVVGNWRFDFNNSLTSEENVRLVNGTLDLGVDFLMTNSTCSRECVKGEVKIQKSKKCCWYCHKCNKNERVFDNQCIACLATESVVNNTCVRMPEVSKKRWPLILGACVGFLITLFTLALFLYRNSSRVVKCSGRDLCYMMLMGLILMFCGPIVFAMEPSTGVCLARSALPGLSFLICYASLFLRTTRIHRIFVQAQNRVTTPQMISPRSQVVAVGFIVLLQVMLVAIWFTARMRLPTASYAVYEEDFVIAQCNGVDSVPSMFVNIALSVFFVFSCTVLAFKTRHFPKNYNEAKFIGVTLYVTCVIWAVFLPTFYLTRGNGFVKEYLTASLCIVVGLVTLAGIFGQKVRILLSSDNTAQNNDSELVSFTTVNRSDIRRKHPTSDSNNDSGNNSF